MALSTIKKLMTKKPAAAKTRILTAEGWKRRFGPKPLRAKKVAKR